MSKMSRVTVVLWVVLWIGLMGVDLRAAGPTGNIRGTVTDQTGAVLSNASIALTHMGTQAKRQVSTNELGDFLFPELPVGRYEIRVEQIGFKRYVQSGIELTVNANVTVNMELTLGEVTEVVTVSGQGTGVNTTTAEVRELVDSVRIDKLPLNGRNVLALTLLAPGVVDSSGGNTFGQPATAAFFPSASGGKPDSTNFILDGGVNNERYFNSALPFPNPDAVQEFSFLTNSFNAEYGGALGGVVNVVSKSGSNQLHGTLYEYHRNSTLNATNFFTPGKSDNLRRNQGGFSVGGPVRIPGVYNGTDKTFFFASWQGTYLRSQPGSASRRTITAEELQGDFSLLARQTGRPLLDPATGQPAPNNRIDPARLDPIMLSMFKLLPVGDSATGLVPFTTARRVENTTQHSIRIDHNFGTKDSFSARYFNEHNDPVVEYDLKNPFLTGNAVSLFRNLSFTMSDTHIFSPHFIANFNFTTNRSYAPVQYYFPGPSPGDPAGIGVLGFPKGSMINFHGANFLTHGLLDEKYNLFVSNNLAPQLNLTYITGKHDLKWGYEFINGEGTVQTIRNGGNFFFGNQFTSHTLADQLMGLPNLFRIDGKWGRHSRQHTNNLYFRDNFKVSPRLTLNLGLRYEPFLPWAETEGAHISLFRPGQQSKRFPKLPVGAVVAGDAGALETGWPRDLNNFAPRFGFAFDPTGTAKMAIRGGFGIFYGAPMGSVVDDGFSASFPFSFRLPIASPGSLGPGAIHDVFRTGTPNQIANPFLVTTGLPTPDFEPPKPISYSSVAPDFVSGYSMQWNLSLEREIVAYWIASASYQGSKSTHLFMGHERNPAIFIPGNGPDGLPLSTVSNANQRRPYGPAFANISEAASDGNSNYNAMTLQLRKTLGGEHWWSRSSLETHYTWSHTLDVLWFDIAPSGIRPRNPFNNRLDYGNSNFDHRQRFVLSYVSSFPTLSGSSAILRTLAGGWNSSAIVQLQDGNPFSIASGFDNSRSGSGGSDSADQVLADASLPDGRSKGEKILAWFNPKAFTSNAIGTYGGTGKNILRGPGYANVDFALYKDFHLGRGESRYVELRGEFFNLFNRTNLQNPRNNRADAFFGRIFGAGEPRILQLAVKIYF